MGGLATDWNRGTRHPGSIKAVTLHWDWYRTLLHVQACRPVDKEELKRSRYFLGGLVPNFLLFDSAMPCVAP